MRSNQTNERQTRPRTGYRRLTPWVLAGAMIPALIGAQSPAGPQSTAVPMVTVGKSAEYSIFAGHLLAFRIHDVGSVDAVTEVTLEIRDADNKRRAFKAAEMKGNQAVELLLRIPEGTGRNRFRGIFTLTPKAYAERSQPIAILEDIDIDSFTIGSKPPCAVRMADQPDPPSGAETDCDGGWQMSRVTLEEASSALD